MLTCHKLKHAKATDVIQIIGRNDRKRIPTGGQELRLDRERHRIESRRKSNREDKWKVNT